MFIDLVLFLMRRDIKGANILVDPNGEIKLADFGMAKHVCLIFSPLQQEVNYYHTLLKYVKIYFICQYIVSNVIFSS